MALTQTQTLPAPFLTDTAKQYATDIGALTAKPFTQQQMTGMGPQIAGQDPYQQDAYTMAGQGIGAYEPYITGQGAYAGTPTDMRGQQDYLTQAGAYSGPQAYQQFMSPYQQDVIDKTLGEYDIQAQKGMTGIGTLAAKSGNLGGGREGVMRSEYQSASDKNRAMLQAQMLQSGYGQAQKYASQAFGQQRNLAQDMSGLGQDVYKLQGQDVSRMGQMGATQQAQAQAEADALRERNRMAAYEPYERLGYLGSGLTGLMGGMGSQYTSTVTPNKSPLEQALGILSTGVGAYRAFQG